MKNAADRGAARRAARDDCRYWSAVGAGLSVGGTNRIDPTAGQRWGRAGPSRGDSVPKGSGDTAEMPPSEDAQKAHERICARRL